MTPDELKHRTRTFAIEVIKLAKSLPSDFVTAHIARQLMRCGTSVGANYRSSCRAKSEADFISKMSTVEEKADETGYWLEVLIETSAVSVKAVAAVMSEASNWCGLRLRRSGRQEAEAANPQSNPQSAIRDPQYGVC